MKTLRRIGRVAASIALWSLMIVGAGSLALWALNAAGRVQPLIVVSGSMSPAIETGDLLIATPTAARDLVVGDIATIRSPQTGDLVTHRVIEISESDGTVIVRMQGDANPVADIEEYVLDAGEPVWQPRVTIPGGGFFVSSLMRPAVAIPLVLGILALCALSLFPSRGARGNVGQATALVPSDGARLKEARPNDALSEDVRAPQVRSGEAVEPVPAGAHAAAWTPEPGRALRRDRRRVTA